VTVAYRKNFWIGVFLEISDFLFEKTAEHTLDPKNFGNLENMVIT